MPTIQLSPEPPPDDTAEDWDDGPPCAPAPPPVALPPGSPAPAGHYGTGYEHEVTGSWAASVGMAGVVVTLWQSYPGETTPPDVLRVERAWADDDEPALSLAETAAWMAAHPDLAAHLHEAVIDRLAYQSDP